MSRDTRKRVHLRTAALLPAPAFFLGGGTRAVGFGGGRGSP
ncbi:hypothetical protein ACFWP3_26645 [Streptomyces sp. NPDC058525]